MDSGAWQGFTVSEEPAGVRVVTLDGPRLHALTQGAKRDLVELFVQAQSDDAVRVLVITGADGAFCAGDDVTPGAYHDEATAPTRSTLLPPTGESPVRLYDNLRSVSQAVTLGLRGLDKPTLAAVDGVAIQSGLTLALGCDLRVASPRARLGSATLRFGFLPDEGGHHLLVEHLGAPRTMDFLLRKRIVDAAEALALGLVNEVVDDALVRALELAAELAAGPQTAMRLLKRAVWKASRAELDASLDDIAIRTAVSDHHADTVEGVAAFRERRSPVFNAELPA